MKPGETILPAASIILSADCNRSAPTDLMLLPSINTEPLGMSSWLVPDHPTTSPPSTRMLIFDSFQMRSLLPLREKVRMRGNFQSAGKLCYRRCVVYSAVQRVPVNIVHVAPAPDRGVFDLLQRRRLQLRSVAIFLDKRETFRSEKRRVGKECR